MESLQKLQGLIDDIFHHFEEKEEVFPENAYLEMMDLCKVIHRYVIGDKQFTDIRNRVFCFTHHTNDCDCTANALVNSLIRDYDEIPRLHKIIAALVAEQYGL